MTYAVARGLITPEERELIAVTTITRYLPNVRTALALLNSEDCRTNAPVDQFDGALRRFLKDSLGSDLRGAENKPPVNSRAGAKQRDTYAETLRQEGVAPATRNLPEYDPATQAPPAAAASKTSARARSAADPSKRKQLIPDSFSVKVKDTILLRLVREGKEAHPDETPFSCNYLNRAILERVVFQYARKNGCGPQGEFSEVLRRVIDHAKQWQPPPSKGILNTMTKFTDKKSPFCYEMLSQSVHAGAIPTGKENRINWENLQPVLEGLLAHM